jgi:hypothetical protein
MDKLYYLEVTESYSSTHGWNHEYPGPNFSMTGDVSGLYGDCTYFTGDVSGITGNCTFLYGDCTGIIGDLNLVFSGDDRDNFKRIEGWATEVEVDG